jgi:hypothetical protein
MVLRSQHQLEPRPYNTSEVPVYIHEKAYKDEIVSQERRILLVRIQRTTLNDLSQLFVLGHFALIVGLHLSVPLFLVEISLKELLHQP